MAKEKDNLDTAPGPAKANTQEESKAGNEAVDHLNKKSAKKKPNRGNRANWGGKRSGAGGVKPTLEKTLMNTARKQRLEEHVEEEIEVEVTVMTKQGPKKVKIKKPRVVIALEKMFQRGVKGDGDTVALDKWLDRAYGKPNQGIELSGELKVEQRMPHPASKAGVAAYLATLKKEKHGKSTR
jgi:hypothetical protein